jgi:acetyl-CoA C-acetyltransferase
LKEGIAIVGLGYSGFSPATRGLSYKELMFKAAAMAYDDAGIDVRKDVQSFVCCTEDFWEGNSIADEYMPDQLGAVLGSVCTVTGEGLYGLITGFMQIKTGLVDTVVVEAHSKLSNVMSKDDIALFAFDPVFARTLGANPYFLAGMEMNRFLYETGNSRESCAQIASQNFNNAVANPRGSYGSKASAKKILSSQMIAHPLTEMEVSKPADACVVLVLSSEQKAKSMTEKPVWIEGVGWCSDTPWIESRDLADATYAAKSAQMAYRMAAINDPVKDLDFAEIDDTFSYKELQHMEALALCKKGHAGKLVEQGYIARDGTFPVNPSGGSLGVGHFVEATGLHKVLEASLQLRGAAGKMQINGSKRALVQSWRGIPTASGAVAILGGEDEGDHD